MIFKKLAQEFQVSLKRFLSAQETNTNEDLFRLMVKSVKDYAIFLLDPQGNIASWNEGARRFKGYEAHEVIGKHFSIFYTQSDLEKNHPEFELKRAYEDGRFEEEGWRLRKDGSRFWANVVITRINDSNGNLIGYAKVSRDLSEKKRTEEALKKAYNDLERRVQERTADLEAALRSRDEFLSIASHELKTPLTSLRLQLQISSRKIEKEETDSPILKDLSKSLEIGVRQVTSLTHLVNDLLDVSRIQTGNFELNPERINLSELVDEISARFKEQLSQARCTLELHLDPDVTGTWDRSRMEQVIVNLLSNAIKYAPQTAISITTHQENGRGILEVSDQGPGIDPENIDKIFNRFERGSGANIVGGLGLGLFITKKIVEHHKGTIRVVSSTGRGARFIVELPLK